MSRFGSTVTNSFKSKSQPQQISVSHPLNIELTFRLDHRRLHVQGQQTAGNTQCCPTVRSRVSRDVHARDKIAIRTCVNRCPNYIRLAPAHLNSPTSPAQRVLGPTRVQRRQIQRVGYYPKLPGTSSHLRASTMHVERDDLHPSIKYHCSPPHHHNNALIVPIRGDMHVNLNGAEHRCRITCHGPCRPSFLIMSAETKNDPGKGQNVPNIP